MAQFTWTFDMPTGVWKNHALSARLYQSAVEETVFMDYVRPVDSFGRGMGESVTLKRVSAIAEPSSPNLVEGIRIPEDNLTLSTRAITVVEVGRAVPFTSFAEDLSDISIENTVQAELKRQMKLALDTKAAAAFKTAQVKYAITGLASSTITTNGTFGATSTANMNVFHAEEIRDYLFDTLRAPPFMGDDYIGIFRTRGIRGLS